MPPLIGVPSTAGSITPLGDLILSIRDKIPDKVTDPSGDGGMFSLQTLLRWINHTATEMCAAAPVLQDWGAIASEQGQDVYVINSQITDILQLWYDLWPCAKQPEQDTIFVSKVSGRSYFCAPHSSHYIPRLSVWPCADHTAYSTTLSSGITATDVTIPLTSVTNILAFGFIQIESEIILYRTVNTAALTLTQVIRGQAGTTAVAHTSGTKVTCLNIMYKCARLPNQVSAATDVLELPLVLQPVLELGVMAEVREAEQDFQEARQLRTEFDKQVDKLAQRAVFKLRQGTQVRVMLPGPMLYGYGPFGTYVQ